MVRKIIEIDEDKCNGCGLCAEACHEGAIGMVSGKAKLLRDDYCDGLGDCLPACPTNAITFVQREAAAYDAAAVQSNMAQRAKAASGHAHGNAAAGAGIGEAPQKTGATLPCGCPGTAQRTFNRHTPAGKSTKARLEEEASEILQWPLQIKLVPVQAPFYEGASLLIAADCTAFAYKPFQQRFMRGHITLIGCPKLDDVDYTEKLTAILQANDIKSVTVVRMEVPCCAGIENAVRAAVKQSGRILPLAVATISTDGRLLEEG